MIEAKVKSVLEKVFSTHVVCFFQGNLGLRHSPGSRNSSRAASCEDLLSDTASIASDISDTSLNSSLQGKRTLVPPSKVTHRNLLI